MVDTASYLVKRQHTIKSTDKLYRPVMDLVCMLASIPFKKISVAEREIKCQLKSKK